MTIIHIQTETRSQGIFYTNRPDIENIEKEVQGLFDNWITNDDEVSFDDFLTERLSDDFEIYPFEDVLEIICKDKNYE